MKKGFWNGTENIKYEVVDYVVPKAPVKTWWQNAFTGKTRQGILITRVDKLGLIESKPFLIDNEDGAGWVKIQSNGTPNLSHRSVAGEEISYSIVVDDDKIKTIFDANQYAHDNIVFEAFLRKYHPEYYVKIMSMKQELINSRTKLN